MGTLDTRGGSPQNDPAADQADGPCEVCGQGLDSCFCPNCATCGVIGRAECYHEHGLEALPMWKALYLEQRDLRRKIDDLKKRRDEIDRVAIRMLGAPRGSVVDIGRGRKLAVRGAQMDWYGGGMTDSIIPTAIVTGSPILASGQPSKREIHARGQVFRKDWKLQDDE